MGENRFILEPYKGKGTRYVCPACQDRGHTFVRYIDNHTGDHLGEVVGRCNRESKCGYHYTPKDYFRDNGTGLSFNPVMVCSPASVKTQRKQPSFLPFAAFKQSLSRYEFNHLAKFLNSILGPENTESLIQTYFLGSSRYWEGSTVFWQIDLEGRIRTGKIMQYNPLSGKRVKGPDNRIGWVHKVLRVPDFNLNQCFFGEHLLRDKTRFVALVESEKTALIASIYFPRFIWLATGGLSNLTEAKCQVLKGRTVVLFPDLKGHEKWKARAKELSHIATFIVSDLLERRASQEEIAEGLDLADYLVRFNPTDFWALKDQNHGQNHGLTEAGQIERGTEERKEIAVYREAAIREETGPEWRPGEWTQDLKLISQFFEERLKAGHLPPVPFKINPWTPIGDIRAFITFNLEAAEAQNGNPTYRPYLERLIQLKRFLEAFNINPEGSKRAMP